MPTHFFKGHCISLSFSPHIIFIIQCRIRVVPEIRFWIHFTKFSRKANLANEFKKNINYYFFQKKSSNYNMKNCYFKKKKVLDPSLTFYHFFHSFTVQSQAHFDGLSRSQCSCVHGGEWETHQDLQGLQWRRWNLDQSGTGSIWSLSGDFLYRQNFGHLRFPFGRMHGHHVWSF